MNLSAWALRHRALTLYLMLAVAAAGVWAYLSLGRAEIDRSPSSRWSCKWTGRVPRPSRWRDQWLTGWSGSWRRFRRWISLKATFSPVMRS